MGAEVQPVLWVHNAVQAQAPTSSGPSGASVISVDREETSDDIFSPQQGAQTAAPRTGTKTCLPRLLLHHG